MVLDRFILQEVVKKGYHVVLFGGHILILWSYLPPADALLYSGYTVVSYVIYGVIMLLAYGTGQFGNDFALPVRKQLANLFPLFGIVIEE
jgi:hypothetical protein